MNKEQKTIKKIQELVPEIMELKFGCKVIVKGIRENNPGCEYDIVIDKRELENGKICLGYFGTMPIEHIEILGRDITLFDIKQCLMYYGYSIKEFTEIAKIWEREDNFNAQSDKLKDKMYELIIKNKNG